MQTLTVRHGSARKLPVQFMPNIMLTNGVMVCMVLLLFGVTLAVPTGIVCGAFLSFIPSKEISKETLDSELSVFFSSRPLHSLLCTVTTLAGSGSTVAPHADGAGLTAAFHEPQGVAVDSRGTVYVGDTSNHCVRIVSPDGVVHTLAGSAPQRGFKDGTGPQVAFHEPNGVAVDPHTGNVVVADTRNHRVRIVSPSGEVHTLAGSGSRGGFKDGMSTQASFRKPTGVAVDPHTGAVVVADTFNHAIRIVSPAGVVSTLAGNGSKGFRDGLGTNAAFHHPTGVAVDHSGNVYVSDIFNQRIRVVSLSSGQVRTLAGSGWQGYLDGTGTHALFYYPSGVAIDPQHGGSVVIVDHGNHRIRRVSLTGVVSTIAGTGTPGFQDGMGAVAAQFHQPIGVAVDVSGQIYITDLNNHRVRVLSPDTTACDNAASSSSPHHAEL